MNVIEATGLGKRYRGTWALRECTLAVPEGHVVAMVGPNGAGKTTLLNMSVGLTAPTEGRAAVLGGRLAGSPARWTASRSSRRTRRCTRTCPPGTCCT